MFDIGDKVLYPLHGAGVIEAVEEKEIHGESQLYYVLNIPIIDMHVLIPLDKTTNLGIRKVVEPAILEDVLMSFHCEETDPVIYSNQKNCNTLIKSKLRSGDIYQGAEVIRDLTRKNKKKNLGTIDKINLSKARQILVSELVQVKGIAEEQAVNILNQVVNI